VKHRYLGGVYSFADWRDHYMRLLGDAMRTYDYRCIRLWAKKVKLCNDCIEQGMDVFE
jgi:hypothetical protein